MAGSTPAQLCFSIIYAPTGSVKATRLLAHRGQRDATSAVLTRSRGATIVCAEGGWIQYAIRALPLTEGAVRRLEREGAYPSFNATSGGTRIARREGTYVATRPTATRRMVTAARVAGSCGVTPNR